MTYQPPLNGKRISIKADSNPAIESGEVTLASGDNITLEQSGNTITIDGTFEGGGGGGGGDVEAVGVIKMYAGTTAPTGWHLCDGSAVSRETYADLFAVIGTTYGEGDGSTTFNLPDLRGRVPAGLHSEQTQFDALGTTGGEIEHQLTVGEMPSHTHIQDPHTHTQNAHTHTQNAHTHTQNAHSHGTTTNFLISGGTTYGGIHPDGAWFGFNPASATGSTTATNQNTTATNQNTTATNQNTTATNQNTGGDEAHNNLQPYVVVNYIIKLVSGAVGGGGGGGGGGGSSTFGVSTKTSNYTITTDDTMILADATSSNVTLTLPLASEAEGSRFYVKRIDDSENTVTIARSGSDTIDGQTSATITTQWAVMGLVSDGSAWYIL